MRNTLCRALLKEASDPCFVFLTGDLGFMALEPLREAMGERFINAGVAEQNMVSTAAGMARAGMTPWVYSIAPFLYARPFEQIRNDVCMHRLPVRLVGNGGGYAYGVMGSTHHALEDYGALLTLPHLRAYVPAFASDVESLVPALHQMTEPVYLRLGASEEPRDWAPPTFAPWRRLMRGDGPTLVAVGPIAGSLVEPLRVLPDSKRPNFWVLAELPVSTAPDEFLEDLHRSAYLIVVEEHVAHGGAGQMLAHLLLSVGRAPRTFVHRAALGYPSGRFGSQRFHRRECGLDPESILHTVRAAADLHRTRSHHP
jgi:transketolase